MSKSISCMIAVLCSCLMAPALIAQTFGKLPDPATYAPRGMGTIAIGKGVSFNGAPTTGPCAPSFGTGLVSANVCRPSQSCPPPNCGSGWRNRCSNNWIIGYPSVGFWGPGWGWGGGGYYASPSYYDSFANQQMQDQNYLLRQQLEELRKQNDELREQTGQKAKTKTVSPRGKKTPEQIERDRKVLAAQRAERYTNAGARLFATGSYYRAADQFKQSIRHVPDDPTPYFYMAQALFASGKYHEATEAIKDGLKINPDWVGLEFDMRTMYKNPADVVTQLAELGKTLKDNPLDRNALFLLGFELYVTGQRDKARVVFEQVARLESDDRHLQPFFDYLDPDAPTPDDVPLMKVRGEEQTVERSRIERET